MSTFNTDVAVNVYNESQSVDIANFGRLCFATDDVEVGFTENYRIYESNNAAQTDTDLSATAKLAAAAFFAQPNRPKDLMIAKVVYATINTSLDTLLAEVGGTSYDFYGVVTEDQTQANLELLATWCDSNGKICIVQTLDAAVTAGTLANVFENIQATSTKRCAGVWHDDATDYVALAWLATILSADMDSESSVAHDKNLIGPSAPPSTAIDDTKKATVIGLGGNLYLPFFGDPVMRPGVMLGGDWIEDTILEDWTEARLQEAFARLAKRQSAANSKIPYNDFGIAMCEAEIRGVIDKGVSIGHFNADSLVLDVPLLSEVSAAVRATKTLTISGTVTKAGAIKDLNFNVGLTF